MSEQYPFILATNRIAPLLDAIVVAARPPKFSQEFLRNIGFTSSNDRAFIPLFRKLGFIDENGNPTEAFDRLRDRQQRPRVLAERLRHAYEELFAINTRIFEASEDDLRGAISRVTGKDASTVQRYASTFKSLANVADFSISPATSNADNALKDTPRPKAKEPPIAAAGSSDPALIRTKEFHYNIQIHLPATSDISVYNAIFRSLKENLDL